MKISLIIGLWIVALGGGLLLYSAQQQAASLADAGKATGGTVAEVIADAEQAAAAAAVDGKVSFSLPDMEGNSRQVEEWEGKYRVLNFWATWCAPCRREIPLLKAFQDSPAGEDIQVIGVAVDFMEDVIRYAEKAEFNYPILVGQEDAMAIAESSGVPLVGMPFTMIIDDEGRLIDTHMGEIFQEDLDKLATTIAGLKDGSLTIEQAREKL